MIDWQRIPEADVSVPPFDGEDYLLYADVATVDVVRLGRWCTGENEGWARGWWSQRNSVTQEHLALPITHWAEFNQPSEIEEEQRRLYGEVEER